GGFPVAVEDRHALPRDPGFLQDEGSEPPRRAFFLDPPELGRSGELLVESTHPAETGGDRVRLGTDVVPMQGVADLEPQRVAGTEAAGDRAPREHAIPELAGGLGRDEQLHPGLTRVAGPVDRAGNAVELALLEREG